MTEDHANDALPNDPRAARAGRTKRLMIRCGQAPNHRTTLLKPGPMLKGERRHDEPRATLELGVAQIRGMLREEAASALERQGLPTSYADRLLAMVDACIGVVGQPHDVVYLRGLREGSDSAAVLEQENLEQSDVLSRLAEVRTPIFFERLPLLVGGDARSVVIHDVAIFIAGYVRGLHVGNDLSGRRRLGETVRDLSTATSLAQLEQVLVAACVDLAEVEYAFTLRASGPNWTLSHEGHAPRPFVFESDEEMLVALARGQSVVRHDTPLGALVALPIVVDGILDAILIVAHRTRRAFDAQTLATFEILATQAAATRREMIAVAQLRTALARQREIAAALQRAFVPRSFPTVRGLRFDGLYVPAENDALVGGDWYDVFELAGDTVAFTIGDVTGHGIDAAATMHQVRQAIFISALERADPVDVLERVNRGMVALESGIATAVVGFIDLAARSIRYAVAGHPPPIIVRDGHASVLPHGGFPLGIESAGGWSAEKLTWQDGVAASIVLYTDGLTESRHDPLDGERRLRERLDGNVLTGPLRGGEAAALCAEVVGNSGTSDDIALLIVQMVSR